MSKDRLVFGDRVVSDESRGRYPFPIGRGPFIIIAISDVHSVKENGFCSQSVDFAREGRRGLRAWNLKKKRWEGWFTLDTIPRNKPHVSGAWFRKTS